MHFVRVMPALALACTSLGNPILLRRDAAPVRVTADQIGAIAPKTTQCDQKQPGFQECAQASQAAEFISNSFATYKITSPAVAASLIATMALESSEFQYSHNVSPGRPGQGTRNMQMPNYNSMYIKSIDDPAFQAERDAAGEDPVKILSALTRYGNYDFGSAAWFLTTQCQADVQKGLETGDQPGWNAYVTCIGADANDGREKYWETANKVLNVKAA